MASCRQLPKLKPSYDYWSKIWIHCLVASVEIDLSASEGPEAWEEVIELIVTERPSGNSVYGKAQCPAGYSWLLHTVQCPHHAHGHSWLLYAVQCPPEHSWLLHTVQCPPGNSWLLHTVQWSPGHRWLLYTVQWLPRHSWLLHTVPTVIYFRFFILTAETLFQSSLGGFVNMNEDARFRVHYSL